MTCRLASSLLCPCFSVNHVYSLSCVTLYYLLKQSRLQLVLVNFLSNAVRFSISGSTVTINVTCTARSPPNHKLTSRSPLPKGRHSALWRACSMLKRRGSRVQQSPHRDSRVSNKDSQTRFVTVTVNDFGAGIPEVDHGNVHSFLYYFILIAITFRQY